VRKDEIDPLQWLNLKRKKDQADMGIRVKIGDTEKLNDMDRVLKHPCQARTLTEVRQHREGEEREIEGQAAIEEIRLKELKEQARQKGIED
jgi:hypothetical protein